MLPSNIVAACKGSLQRLGTEQLSLGQLHWSASNYAPLQEIALWNGLSDCYEQGLVKAVGVSNYGEEGRGVGSETVGRGRGGARPLASRPCSASAAERLADCYKQGQVKAVGVSNHGDEGREVAGKGCRGKGETMGLSTTLVKCCGCGIDYPASSKAC